MCEEMVRNCWLNNFKICINIYISSKVTIYMELITCYCMDTITYMFFNSFQDLPESVTEKVGGKIFPFGSYHLGVHTRGNTIIKHFLYLTVRACQDSCNSGS